MKRTGSVKFRLSALVATLLSFLLVVGLAGAVAGSKMMDAFTTTYNDRIVPLQQLKTIADMYAVNVVDTTHKVRMHSLSWEEGLKKLDEASKKKADTWRDYRATYLTPEEKRIGDSAEQLMRDGDGSILVLHGIMERKDAAALEQYASGELYQRIDPISAKLADLIDLQLRVASDEFHHAEGAYQANLWLNALLIAGAIVVGIAFACTIIRSLLKELGGEPKYAMTVAQRIAGGDLSGEIVKHRNDQHSVLAAMHAMQQKLHDIIHHVKHSAEQVSSSASELAAAADQVAGGAEQQSSAAASMAAAVEQLSVSIGQVSDHSHHAAKATAHAGTHANEGGTVIHRVVGEMTSIADSVEEALHVIDALGRNSDRISEVVQVIKEVADQTNLLALNAAIEAARAGEQGRGFAVVADEVRKLAERTTESTLEIGTMIAEFQTSSGEAVSSMQAIAGKVREGMTLADGAGESITQIHSHTHSVIDAVNTMSVALEQQRVASSDIALRVEKVASMSEETHAAAQTTTQATHQLEALSRNLRMAVSHFKT